jgi:hypothetical protein
MKTIDIHTKLIEGYLDLLRNLNPSSKLELISLLSKSVKADLRNKKQSFDKAFGTFESKESAEEVISKIHKSRKFNRQIEQF